MTRIETLTITTGRVLDIPYLKLLPDHVCLDVTVKSGDKVFAPTWEMVRGFKAKTITVDEYVRRYALMLAWSLGQNSARWDEVVRSNVGKTLVLCCYCLPPPAFCHRHLLAGTLEAYALGLGLTVMHLDELPKGGW